MVQRINKYGKTSLDSVDVVLFLRKLVVSRGRALLIKQEEDSINDSVA